MSDLVTRLRTWVHSVDAVPASDLMDEAADEIERLRRLSANGDYPGRDNAARKDNDERLAALQALAAVDEELGLPRRTPDTLATPSGCREQDGCTLTDAEREAVRFCVTASLPETEKLGGVAGALCRMHAATLRGLLERMG